MFKEEILLVKYTKGTITGNNYGINNSSGTIYVDGGTIVGTNFDGIYQSGNGNIYLRSGSVTGFNWAAYAKAGWVYCKSGITLKSKNNLVDNGRSAICAVNYKNI